MTDPTPEYTKHTDQNPPEGHRWFQCRHCNGLYIGGRIQDQDVRQERAASEAHEFRCQLEPSSKEIYEERQWINDQARMFGDEDIDHMIISRMILGRLDAILTQATNAADPIYRTGLVRKAAAVLAADKQWCDNLAGLVRRAQLVPLADENHWDVECDQRPDCKIAAHHSIDE